MFSLFPLFYPFPCHFGVIGTTAPGRTVIRPPIIGNEELLTVFALPDSLALAGHKLGIGQIDAGCQIIHLGSELRCFVVLKIQCPFRIADEKMSSVHPLDKLEIEI